MKDANNTESSALAPAVDVSLHCPYCGSRERQVKAGTNNGIQRYKCGVCKRRYTPLADGPGYPDPVRERASQLHHEGKTIREIARDLKVSRQSVANWLRKSTGETDAEEAALRPSPISGKARPTIRDVALQANVSTSSVSNYLNQKGRMAEPTRQRIRAAMQELHFTPSALVRAIKRRRTGILGVILQAVGHMDDLEGPSGYLVPSLLRGLNDGANAAHNDLLLYTGGRTVNPDDLEARLLGGHIDGLIWMTPGEHMALLERVVAAGLPVVALMTHQVPNGVHYVAVDNKGGMRQLVEHLAEQGHQRIAYVGPDWSTDFRDRHEGYREAMLSLGLEWEPSLQVITRRQDFRSSDRSGTVAAWFDLPSPPTAILCNNDHTALQFANEIHKRGLRIPEDIALAGFDDMPIAEHVAGGLTTIRQPFRRMGKLAAETLLALVEGGPTERKGAVLPVELVIRASTRFIR